MSRGQFKCIDCGSSFDIPNATGRAPQRCAPCAEVRRKTYNAERQKAWRRANPERAREHWNRHNRKRLADPEFVRQRNAKRLLDTYGITVEQLDALIASQGGKCAVCGGDPNGPGTRLHIDHCHDSKRIRGLLCAKCNTAVGLLDDDPERAEALAAYLRR